MRARWLLWLVMISVVLVAPRAASANVGPRSWGGQLAGEPAGIHDIAILREELAIDMRPLAGDGRVRVTATYHLDNRAAEQALDLVLASGSGEPAESRVTLDGGDVATALRLDVVLPASWQAPAATPLPDGGELDYELRERGAPLGFRLTVPPGRHALAVSYAADAVYRYDDEPTVLRQFAYVLSPARSWAGFGGLDVTVRLPAGWKAGVSPALARGGDTLHAVFSGVPADAIALTVAAPAGAYWLVRYAAGALFAVVALGGGVAVSRAAAARQRRRWAAGKLPSLLAALVGGGAWSAAFLAAGLFAIFGPGLALPAHQADHHDGYGQVFAAMLVVIGALLVLPIGVGVARAAGRRVTASSDAGANPREA
jgi:hypothetical protein